MNQTKNRMLSEIVEVRELAHPQDVNAHIQLGWKLLDTYNATGTQEKQLFKYCVGWPKSAGALNTQNTVAHKGISESKNISDRKRFIYSL